MLKVLFPRFIPNQKLKCILPHYLTIMVSWTLKLNLTRPHNNPKTQHLLSKELCKHPTGAFPQIKHHTTTKSQYKV